MWSGGVYALSATPFAEPSQIPARRHSSTAPAIQDTPVQSAICEPKNGDIISHGTGKRCTLWSLPKAFL